MHLISGRESISPFQITANKYEAIKRSITIGYKRMQLMEDQDPIIFKFPFPHRTIAARHSFPPLITTIASPARRTQLAADLHCSTHTARRRSPLLVARRPLLPISTARRFPPSPHAGLLALVRSPRLYLFFFWSLDGPLKKKSVMADSQSIARYILKKRYDRGSYGEVWMAFPWNYSHGNKTSENAKTPYPEDSDFDHSDDTKSYEMNFLVMHILSAVVPDYFGFTSRNLDLHLLSISAVEPVLCLSISLWNCGILNSFLNIGNRIGGRLQVCVVHRNLAVKREPGRREGCVLSLEKPENLLWSILISHALVHLAQVEQILLPDLALQPLIHDCSSVHAGMVHGLLMKILQPSCAVASLVPNLVNSALMVFTSLE
nr:probable protein phosphatase 2C 51 [Ipomoea batatas]